MVVNDAWYPLTDLISSNGVNGAVNLLSNLVSTNGVIDTM